MSRTHRTLAMLALSLALVAATTTLAAAAAPPPITGIEDQNDRLLRNLQAAQAERTRAAVVLARSLDRNLTAPAAVSSPARIEDQNDRLLRNLQAAQAERTQAAVVLARSLDRNLTPVGAVDAIAAQSAPGTDTEVPRRDLDLLAALLLGLAGGLVGGAAAMAGWTATTRRRLHRTAAA